MSPCPAHLQKALKRAFWIRCMVQHATGMQVIECAFCKRRFKHVALHEMHEGSMLPGKSSAILVSPLNATAKIHANDLASHGCNRSGKPPIAAASIEDEGTTKLAGAEIHSEQELIPSQPQIVLEPSLIFVLVPLPLQAKAFIAAAVDDCGIYAAQPVCQGLQAGDGCAYSFLMTVEEGCILLDCVAYKARHASYY